MLLICCGVLFPFSGDFDLYYVGLQDMDTEGYFFSPEGEPGKFFRWYPGEPDNEIDMAMCAHLMIQVHLYGR